MSDINVDDILLPGEATIQPEEMELIEWLLAKHSALTTKALAKVHHLLKEDKPVTIGENNEQSDNH